MTDKSDTTELHYHTKECNSHRGTQYPCDCSYPSKIKPQDTKSPAGYENMKVCLSEIISAIDAGQLQMDSPWRDGEPEVGIGPSQWHEEWIYHARCALKEAAGHDN